MKFGWLCRSESYHIIKIYKHEHRYVTLCDKYTDNFIDYINDSMGFICPTSNNRVTKDLSYDNLCKKCADQYPKKIIVFELVKAKLCK